MGTLERTSLNVLLNGDRMEFLYFPNVLLNWDLNLTPVVKVLPNIVGLQLGLPWTTLPY